LVNYTNQGFLRDEQGQVCWPKATVEIERKWAIRIRLQLAKRIREPALFNLAIDSKLRGCDLAELRVRDIARGNQVLHEQ
jgi:hypothetical protein